MKKTFVVCTAILLLFGLVAVSNASLIVNVSARGDDGNPTSVTEFLDAGTYLVDPIGILDGGDYDAWSAWDGVSAGNTDTCTDPNGCLQANGFRGWLNSYIVLSPNLENVTAETSNLFVDSTQGYAVNLGVVYPTAGDALANAFASTFYLPIAGNVTFINLDSGSFGNNRGGNSLSVEPVPEPATMLLLGSGLVGLAGFGRKKFFKK